MSWHDDKEEETAPRRDALYGAEEETNVIGHVPDDVRRSASLILGAEDNAEDMTAPTRVREDELQAALAGAMAPTGGRPRPVSEEATEVNVVNTSELDAIIRGHAPARAARPAPRSRPAPTHDPFCEDEPTQANVFRDADLRAASQATGRPPAGATNPFGPPRPYDARTPLPAHGARAQRPQHPPHPSAPQGGATPPERTAPTRPEPRQRPNDEPVGLAAEASWSSHVDDSPIARPAPGVPTGFGPGLEGPTHHPGAPMQREDLSHDALIRQHLAESSRGLTQDELDAVTNNMLMVGAVVSCVLSFFIYLFDISALLIIVVFVVVVGGLGLVSRKFPEPCESFLNVISISVRKE